MSEPGPPPASPSSQERGIVHSAPPEDPGAAAASVVADYLRHCKPGLGRLLAAFGLDICYHRAAGDRLWYVDPAGREREVLDLVGSFGATLLGHNPPELIAAARELLAGELPHLVPASIRAGAAALATRLVGAARARFGIDYQCAVLNTGADAVEGAIKHLILIRRAALAERCDALAVRARSLSRSVGGHSGIPLTVETDPALAGFPPGPFADAEALLSAIDQYHRRLAAGPFRLVGLRQGYHGKSLGALTLTYNDRYRTPFAGHLLPVDAVGFDAPAIVAALERAPLPLARVEIAGRSDCSAVAAEDGTAELAAAGSPTGLVWRVVPEWVPSCMGLVVEPIQGEGGVAPVPASVLAAAVEVARRLGVPVVADEVQTGMGRTGRLFAWEHFTVPAPDLIVLSKFLGGGIAKVAAVLARNQLADDEFGIVHTSTFAEDELGCRLAALTIDLLLADDGRLLGEVRRRGEQWRQRLAPLPGQYPTVVREVRGAGLLWGVEFADLSERGSNLLRYVCSQGDLGYVIAGYLLHEHGIRVAPTLNARRTVRIEPSLHLAEPDMDRVVAALRALADVLARCDTAALLRFVLPECRHRHGAVVRLDATRDWSSDPTLTMQAEPRHPEKVAFLGHFIDPSWLARHEPPFAAFTDDQLRVFIERTWEYLDPQVFISRDVTSTTGARVNFNFVGLSITSDQMLAHLRGRDLQPVRRLVRTALVAARDAGCRLAGFGQFTSIVTRNCEAVAVPGIAFTSGNALTTGVAFTAVDEAVRERGWRWSDLTVAVVGAGGNIGSIFARLMADRAGKVLLLGGCANDSGRRLLATRAAVVADQLRSAFTGRAPVGPIGERIAGWGLPVTALANTPPGEIPGGAPVGEGAGAQWLEPVLARLDELPAAERPVELIGLDRVREAQVVVTASNASRPVLGPAALADEVIVCDISIPSALEPAAWRRTGVTAFKGGVVALPGRESLNLAALPLEPGMVYACMAETILLGLERHWQDFAVGPITREQVEWTLAAARRHGFTLARRKLEDSL